MNTPILDDGDVQLYHGDAIQTLRGLPTGIAQTCIDPFIGSGTTALVARNHGRRCIGIDLAESYLQISARRLQQLSLLAEPTA